MRFPVAFLSLSLAAASFADAQTIAPPDAPQAAAPSASLQSAPVPVSASVSQVRIVRLSQVAGQVELDRKTGQAFDLAFVNLPIVAGAALRTKEGVAEVEFEDNSSLRLTPQSQLDFPLLGRNGSGATITSVNLLHGSLYVSLAEGKAGGDFTVTAGNQTIVVTPSSHLRLDLDAPTGRMVVFQGSATITGPSGSMVVTKKKAISFDSASAVAPEFIHVADAGQFDTWDKNAVDYHKVRTVAANGFAGSPYNYGVNDLDYYGSFSDVGGCGTMWRPHLAGAAFDPYSSGVWSWYPGQGYTWVSLYPWGWTPFHSGSWDYCPAGGGWGWRPQNNWNGLNNHPGLITATMPVKAGHLPVRPTPPPPPVRGGATLVPVNVKSLQTSHPDNDGHFVFRSGSAGLGVPRGVFNDLAKVSQTAEMHGSATTTVTQHQAELGLVAPNRSLASSSSSPAGNVNRSSAMNRGATAVSSSASGSYLAGRSSSISSPPSGAPPASSAPSGPHH